MREDVVIVRQAAHRGGPCEGCVTACWPTWEATPGEVIAVPCPQRTDLVYHGGYDTIDPDDPETVVVYWPTPPAPLSVDDFAADLAGTR